MFHVHLINSNGKVATIFYINLPHETKDTFGKFEIQWDFTDYRNQDTEYYYKFAQYLRYQLRNKIDVKLNLELYEFIKTDEKIDLKEFEQFLLKLKISLINKPIDDIGLNNDIVSFTTLCINGIEKINKKVTT